MKKFELLPHTADIKIRVFGKTKEELFCNALYGMFQLIGPKTELCKMEKDILVCDNFPEKHLIEINSGQQDLLLVDFLSEALYLSDIHHQAYFDMDIKLLDEKNLKAIILGVSIEGFEIEIKAVTYHELELKQVDDIWQAIIVFDI